MLGVDVQDISGDAAPSSRSSASPTRCSATAPARPATNFGILGLPETFVIDRQGRIAAVRRGPVDEAFMREQRRCRCCRSAA